MDRHNIKILKMLYNCIMANTSAIWQKTAHTTYQLSSPNCSESGAAVMRVRAMGR